MRACAAARRDEQVTVVDVSAERGSFVVCVDAFEDRGARWELGFEDVGRFQFACDSAMASGPQLADLQRGAAHFARDLSIACAHTVTLYRAVATDDVLRRSVSRSFVSATFSAEAAQAHFAGAPSTKAAAMWRQTVPIERVLMTCLETAAMNQRFREAEAILVADPVTDAF